MVLLVSLFQDLILSTVVLYCLEMDQSESPFFTVWVLVDELLGLLVLGLDVLVLFVIDPALTLSF